jgi:hypothetical protein
LVAAIARAARGAEKEVRDSDVKRKMLEVQPGFDEAELGFSKFSRFLQQAEGHEIITLRKEDNGNILVSVRPAKEKSTGAGSTVETSTVSLPPVAEAPTSQTTTQERAIGPRAGSIPRRGRGGPPPLLEGQVVSGPARLTGDVGGDVRSTELVSLGLPTGKEAITRYLTNSYRGVGAKTAESLVEAFGEGIFRIMKDDPERLSEVVPRRAEQVLSAFRQDIERRTAGGAVEPAPSSETMEPPAEQAEPTQQVEEQPERPRGGLRPRTRRGRRQS